MKLNWKGKYKGVESLAKGTLPEDAVMFREPKTMSELGWVASIFLIPVFLVVGIGTYLRFGEIVFFFGMINSWGALLALVMIVPHEVLHAIAFPKDAEVDAWYSLKYGMAFVHSTHPVSKNRFIFLSLLPNIVFGFIPFILWVFIPNESTWLTEFWFTFSVLGLTVGVGDYLNVFNSIWQMPKNAVTQHSGFNSYWYIP
ncbi:MAG: DUF3267 domain-containing protein [Clostridiales bacterium]|nr:DUF3267 domain-containing protein [Clostridiales bacterium]